MEIQNLTEGAESFTANVYLVGGDRPSLIDVGTIPGIADEIEEVVALFVTHQHYDHVEEIDEVIEAFDPEVYAYESLPARTHAIEDGDIVHIGDEEFEVVYTPGHADDHVVFISDSTIFSGDVVVYEDGAFSGGSFGRTDYPGQSRDQLIESIETILTRMGPDITRMYPGHGPSYEGDVRDVVERALERAERREPKYPEED